MADLIEHVLHTQRDGGVIKPPFPVAAAILGRGYGHDILLLAVLRLTFLPPSLESPALLPAQAVAD